jgi:hypothetical protein
MGFPLKLVQEALLNLIYFIEKGFENKKETKKLKKEKLPNTHEPTVQL